jgi:hypothetical protein
MMDRGMRKSMRHLKPVHSARFVPWIVKRR